MSEKCTHPSGGGKTATRGCDTVKMVMGNICPHCGRSTAFHDEVMVDGYDRVHCGFCGVMDWALDSGHAVVLKERAVDCEKCGKKHIYSYYETERIVKIDGVEVEWDRKIQ